MKDRQKRIISIIIILLIIVVIIIAFIIALILLNNTNQNQEPNQLEYSDPNKEGKELEHEYDKNINSIISKNDYYNVKYCIEIYQEKINKLLDEDSKENIEIIYSMLDEEFIKEKNITYQSIIDIFKNYKKSNIYIDTIVTTKLSNSVSAYIVKGKLKDKNTIEMSQYDLVIKIDYKNNTFMVCPYEYVIEKKYNQKTSEDELNVEKILNIENKKYNSFINQTNAYSTIAIPYFEKMKADALYDSEFLYNRLDEEYKAKKFGNIQNFQNYIKQNYEKISNMKIQKYARYYYDGYVQYVCIDNNGDYYIFNESSTLNYKILLDTYTIDQPEFIKKYESASNEKKAGYNINKFLEAINDKDYKYAYNCLAESFKQNKFPTQNRFETYIKNNFFNKNIIESMQCNKEGNYYICNVSIKNSNNTDTKGKSFVVNLKENTEFEMSFTIE